MKDKTIQALEILEGKLSEFCWNRNPAAQQALDELATLIRETIQELESTEATKEV